MLAGLVPGPPEATVPASALPSSSQSQHGWVIMAPLGPTKSHVQFLVV